MTTESDQALIDRFLDALWLEKGLSDNTLKAYRSDLEKFGDWAQRHANPIIAISREDLLRYLSHRMGKGLKARSTARCLSCLRALYRYLLREKMLSDDPTLRVENPKLGRPLPETLTEQDVERLLAAPDTNTSMGVRDRTILEVLYACAFESANSLTFRSVKSTFARALYESWERARRNGSCPWGKNLSSGLPATWPKLGLNCLKKISARTASFRVIEVLR